MIIISTFFFDYFIQASREFSVGERVVVSGLETVEEAVFNGVHGQVREYSGDKSNKWRVKLLLDDDQL